METGDEGGHYCLFVVFLVLVSFGGVFDLRVEGVFGDGCRSWRGMRVEEGCWLYKVRQGPRFDLFTTYLTLRGKFLDFCMRDDGGARTHSGSCLASASLRVHVFGAALRILRYGYVG